MKEINKEIGKEMNKICPQFVSTTVHKRHYYMVECKEAYNVYNKLMSKDSAQK